jgi:sialic acid synthase SpsE
MEPDEFALMVKHIRDMERALGDGVKKVEEEESETVIVQRRGLCVNKKIKAGETFKKDNVIELRPALGILPKYKEVVIGHKAKKDMEAGSPIKWEDLA